MVAERFADEIYLSVPADNIICSQAGTYTLENAGKAEQEKIWAEFSRKRPSSFDGELLRLKSFRSGADTAVLTMERTSFSAYIATREPHFGTLFPGLERADPLGITVLVVSRDNQLILTQRSLMAEQNPGAVYFVGGYAEPSQVDANLNVFFEAAREVQEEIAVDDLKQSKAWVIGLAYDPVYCHPELFILAESDYTGEEIISRSLSARDRDEANGIFATAVHSVFSEDHGALPSLPKTWSYLKGIQFARRHYEAAGKL
jgi:hypothetical protein